MSFNPDSFHSRYAPMAEAERYTESSLSHKNPALVIIVGGGKNYIGQAVSRVFPVAKVMLLQPTDRFLGTEVHLPSLHWHPESLVSLENFLRAGIKAELLPGGVSVVEWKPVMKAFPLVSDKIMSAIKLALEEAGASAASSRFWARRWLKNCLRFAKAEPVLAVPEQSHKPIVLACAGPGLDYSLSCLREHAGKARIFALSSALSALASYKLEPELVVSTDPGFWNALHQRQLAASAFKLAIPPSAYTICDALIKNPVLPLYTGLLFEQETLNCMAYPWLETAASGSSSGTALSLAIKMTKGEVFIVGYDLAAHNYVDHSIHYAFNNLETEKVSRTKPLESMRSGRIYETYPKKLSKDGWRSSRAFSVYANGIGIGKNNYHRCTRFSDSPQETPIKTMPLSALKAAFEGLEISESSQAGSRIQQDNMLLNNTKNLLQENIEAAILGSIKKKAEYSILRAVLDKTSINEEASMYLTALAPKESAELLSAAARGQAKPADAKAVMELADAAIAGLLAGLLGEEA